MKKKIIATCAVVAMALLSVGCSSEDRTAINNLDSVLEYRDSDTGVHYLIYDGYNGGGICPKYNSDGTLYAD